MWSLVVVSVLGVAAWALCSATFGSTVCADDAPAAGGVESPMPVVLRSELVGTLMAANDAGPTVVLEVLCAAGTGRWADSAGDLVRVVCDAGVYTQACDAGLRPLGELAVSLRASQVPGELFWDSRVTVAPAPAVFLGEVDLFRWWGR